MVWPISSCSSRATSAHALFRLQQTLRQTAVARQLGLQGLVQLAQALYARAKQQPGQALGQQRAADLPGDRAVWLAISAMAFISVAINAPCQP